MAEPKIQRHDEKTLASETLASYVLPMERDFLEYVRQRRSEIRKELQDLDTAEEIYRRAKNKPKPIAIAEIARQPALFRTVSDAAAEFARKPKTIQEMVLQLLDEAHPKGLSALEILDEIQRRWRPDLVRTSLSPQLSRLQPKITHTNGKWSLALKTKTGAPADAPA